jgi:molybdenum cofactor guanylyltransferase
MQAPYPIDHITGVVLAGGRARRMGGIDKGLIRLNDRLMIEYIIDAFRPQVCSLMINDNRNLETYEKLSGYPVITDLIPDYAGPLAGMASAMQAAHTEYILTVPCDSPFLAVHLAQRLYTSLTQCRARLSVAGDGRRMQPVFALLSRSLLTDLLDFLGRGERKIDRWYQRHHTALADLSDAPDSFLNINSAQDLQKVQRRLSPHDRTSK